MAQRAKPLREEGGRARRHDGALAGAVCVRCIDAPRHPFRDGGRGGGWTGVAVMRAREHCRHGGGDGSQTEPRERSERRTDEDRGTRHGAAERDGRRERHAEITSP